MGPELLDGPSGALLEHLCTSSRVTGSSRDDGSLSACGCVAVGSCPDAIFSSPRVVPCRYWVTLTMLSQPSLLLKSC